MQHCDLNALARCSRTALAAATTPVAWCHQPPLVVRGAAPDLPARLAGSLLSHCPLALVLAPISPQPFPTPVTDEELRVVAALPRLRSLDTRGRSISPSAFAELLQRPVLSGLTALYTGRKQLDSACTALLPLHQRGLRTLLAEAPGDSAAPGFFAPLPLLPALTDLSVVLLCRAR
jgi:hypothetical protein